MAGQVGIGERFGSSRQLGAGGMGGGADGGGDGGGSSQMEG